MSNNELRSTSQGCGCSAGLRRSRPVAVSSAWTPACLTPGSPARTDPCRWRHTERRTPQETRSHTSTKLPVRHCLIVQNLRVALCFLPASADDGGACCRAGTWEAKAEEPEQSEASFEVSTLLWLWLEGRRLCPIRLWETLTTWIELNFRLLLQVVSWVTISGWLFFLFFFNPCSRRTTGTVLSSGTRLRSREGGDDKHCGTRGNLQHCVCVWNSAFLNSRVFFFPADIIPVFIRGAAPLHGFLPLKWSSSWT